MSSFLDDFQSNLDSIPHIIRRKYSLLRDLDKSLQEIQRQSEQRCGNEIEQFKRDIKSGDITPDASNIKFSDEATDEQKHAVRIADEKVALAVQAYDLVDAHIQQLDQYLKEELQREKETVSSTGSTAESAGSNLKSGKGAESGRGGRKKSRLSAATTASSTTNASAANPTSMDLDLPVDPNEPTYCLCNQVSFGEMVGCDNADCKVEWFHFGCVGLKEKPKGKWYCSDCSAKKNKRKGK